MTAMWLVIALVQLTMAAINVPGISEHHPVSAVAFGFSLGLAAFSLLQALHAREEDR